MSSLYDRTKVRKGVVHHLGDGLPACKTADELKRRANPHLYSFPEYDYGILDDGTIVPMRPLTYIGSHCIATKNPYNSYVNKLANGVKDTDGNWWNKNSIGVVLGIDSTKYKPSVAMIDGLITLLTKLCKQQGMTMDDWYPHYQVVSTACPGAKYSKLKLNTGNVDYDYVEASVIKNLQSPAPTSQTVKPLLLNIDTPVINATVKETINVAGWTLIPSEVAKVEVQVSNQTFTANYGSSRPDVAKAIQGYPNESNSGFNFALDTTKFPNGKLEIKVIAVGKDNKTIEKSISVTVNNVVVQQPVQPTSPQVDIANYQKQIADLQNLFKQMSDEKVNLQNQLNTVVTERNNLQTQLNAEKNINATLQGKINNAVNALK